MESRRHQQSSSNDRAGGYHHYRRADDEMESNVSYGSSNEEDPILTATITFDVTVDPNGQVISTSEGQIIAEGIHQPIDGRTLNLLEHNPIPLSQITSVAGGGLGPTTSSAIQADSLTSMNSTAAAGGVHHYTQRSKDLTILQDSLDENESDSDESTSTSTESLIERSKRYMNQEAGIIILKRENAQSKNFNINLDFDLANNKRSTSVGAVNSTLRSSEDVLIDQENRNPAAKGFNINLDFDIDNSNSVGNVNKQANGKKTGVDIDLMITSSTTTSRVEHRAINETFEEIHNIMPSDHNLHHHHNHHHHQQTAMPADLEYWRQANRDGGPSKKTLDPNLIENESSWTTLNNQQNNTSQEFSKLINQDSIPYEGFHVINKLNPNEINRTPMDHVQHVDATSRRAASDAKFDLIDRIVERAVTRAAENNHTSNNTIHINNYQRPGGDYYAKQAATAAGVNTSLRPLDNVDVDGLLRGFEAEEVKDGKLVLYITEKQLSQLLTQRAVIVPNRSLKPPQETTEIRQQESIYRPANPVSNTLEQNPVSSSVDSARLGTSVDSAVATAAYRTTNSLSSIAEEERRNASLRDEDLHYPATDLTSPSDYQTTLKTATVTENQSDELALGELDGFVRRLSSQVNAIDWPTIRADYRDKADLMKRYVSSLLADDRATRSNRYTTKSKSSFTTEEDKLKAVDEFVDQVLNRKKQKESEKSLRLLDNLVDRLVDTNRAGEVVEADEEALRSIHSLLNSLRASSTMIRPAAEKSRTGNKIIIRTTRKLPAKVYITGGKNLVKKKITYSYLDNYKPSTRVYEVANNTMNNINETSMAQAADLFNAKNGLSYLVKTFDPAIADSIGKPSVEQINKYLSVVNTGVKNADLVQIHPLLNAKTEIKNNSNLDATQTYPSFKEPVIIDSEDYPKYIQDISKHFGGLQVTDFPLYVQGLEFKQNPNPKSSQSIVLTKPTKPSNEGIQNNHTISTQLVNNINNVQYVRVNNSTPTLVAH